MSEKKSWTAEQFARWYREHPVIPARDYLATLVPRIQALAARDGVHVETYGSATYTTNNQGTNQIDHVTHDLYRILIGDMDPAKPTYLIFGGTHGYEKGGPLAALGFAEEEAERYAKKYNIVIYPCLCPGPYEKELRYTEGRIDPNRDAVLDGAKSQEMQALAASLQELHARLYTGDLTRKFAAAVDLHETPAKDLEINQENAEAAGELFKLDIFPEGLFLIAFDQDAEFATRMIAAIKNEGHKIVEDPTIYDVENSGGILFMSKMGNLVGRVRQLSAHFTQANVTIEQSGIGITDDMPDALRAEPQRAAIRAMFPG